MEFEIAIGYFYNYRFDFDLFELLLRLKKSYFECVFV